MTKKIKHCNDCVHFVFVSKCGGKPTLNCERVGYGTRAENRACDRFKDIPDNLHLFKT